MEKNNLIGVRNRIKHGSDWDGTLRTYKAEAVLRRLKPKNARDLGRKLAREYNLQSKTFEDIEYPFLLNDKRLEKFVKDNNDDPKWSNYYRTHIDQVDINADIWKLSKEWQQKYPSKHREVPKNLQILFGSSDNISEGWHTAKRQSDSEYDDELDRRREREDFEAVFEYGDTEGKPADKDKGKIDIVRNDGVIAGGTSFIKYPLVVTYKDRSGYSILGVARNYKDASTIAKKQRSRYARGLPLQANRGQGGYFRHRKEHSINRRKAHRR